VRIFDLLFENGLDINATAQGGEPVNSMLADVVTSITRPMRVLEWLLAHGADPTARIATGGMRICDYVVASGVKPLVQLFEQFTADEHEPAPQAP